MKNIVSVKSDKGFPPHSFQAEYSVERMGMLGNYLLLVDQVSSLSEPGEILGLTLMPLSASHIMTLKSGKSSLNQS